MDYILNASDLMDLGKDTGRLDGEVAGTRGVGNGVDGSYDEDEDDEGREKERGGKSAMGSKKLRTNLEKGEVRRS